MANDNLDAKRLEWCKNSLYNCFIFRKNLDDTSLIEEFFEMNEDERNELFYHIRDWVYEQVAQHTLNSEESIKNFDYHNFQPFSQVLFGTVSGLWQYSKESLKVYPLLRMIELACLGGIHKETLVLKNAVKSPLLSDADKMVLQAYIDGQSNFMDAVVATTFVNNYYHQKGVIKGLSSMPEYWGEAPSLLATQTGLNFLEVQRKWYEKYRSVKLDQRSLTVQRAVSQADYSRGLPVNPIPESKFQQYKEREDKLAALDRQLQMTNSVLSQNSFGDLSQMVSEFQNQQGEGSSAKRM